MLTAYGQWSANTSISWSYSGLSQLFKAEYSTSHLTLSLGPNVNTSRLNYPWSGLPGLTTELDYRLQTSGTSGYGFVRYDWSPLSHAHIHEVFIGYGLLYQLSDHFSAIGNLGMGVYKESARSHIEYTLKGISFCSTVGLSYRF
jgi:hypothetical protein